MILKKNLFGCFVIIGGYFFFTIVACASVRFDGSRSRGAYVVRSQVGDYVIGEISVEYSREEDLSDYGVFMRMSEGGREVKMRDWGRYPGQEKSHFYTDPVPINISSSFMLEISFLIKKDNELIDRYEDFIIVQRDDAYELMKVFDLDLVKPGLGDQVSGRSVEFEWPVVRGASYYELRLYRGDEFDTHRIIFKKRLEGNNYKIDVEELLGLEGLVGEAVDFKKIKHFFWRLEAVAESGPDVDNVVKLESEKGQTWDFVLS